MNISCEKKHKKNNHSKVTENKCNLEISLAACGHQV